MLFHPVAYYLRHAAEALERAIRERAAGRPCHPPLSTAAAYLRVAIKARAWGPTIGPPSTGSRAPKAERRE